MLNRLARKPIARPRPAIIKGIEKNNEFVNGMIVRVNVFASGSMMAPRNIA